MWGDEWCGAERHGAIFKGSRMKTVLVIGDMHCGHMVGLTPPSHFECSKNKPKRHKVQMEMYDTFLRSLDQTGRPDILLVLGDCIEGKGEKSGGTELITSDRFEQCDMAVEIIKKINAKKIVMVYGTPYHTGAEEDFERQVADDVGAEKIGGHEWPDVNGVIFDIKHYIGSSQNEHGRHTPLANERISNLLWSEFEESPKADIFLRAHVHYYAEAGGKNWIGRTIPSLQGKGSKFGVLRCRGMVHFGMLFYEVFDKTNKWGERYAEHKLISSIHGAKAKALKL